MMQPIAGGRGGASVCDASQHAGHGSVPAHRARAVSEAAGGGRPGSRLRDQSQFPQRRFGMALESRVHDAGGLSGVHRLSGIMDLTQESITEAAIAVNGSPKSKWTRRERQGSCRRARLVQLAAHDDAGGDHQILARKSWRKAGDERLQQRGWREEIGGAL